MKRSNYRILLDIRDSHGACQLDMKQGDTHRRLYITLTDGGKPYRVSEGCYGVFTAKKPDGIVIYNHCSIEDGAVIYDITPQTTATPGYLSCEIRLLHADTPLEPDENGVLILPEAGVQLLTTAAFGILVHPTVYNENTTLASENEVSALSRMVLEARQALQLAQATQAVTVTVEGDVASENAGAIHTYSTAGRAVLLQLGDAILPLVSAEAFAACFVRYTQTRMELHIVADDGSVNVVSLPLDKLAILDDTSLTGGAWSAKKILEMIAQGGTKDIHMAGRSISGAGQVGIAHEESGTSAYMRLGGLGQDADGMAANVLELEGSQLDADVPEVIIRGVAPGVGDSDAVNKGQLDAVEQIANEKAQIDNAVIGDTAWSSKNIVDRLCPAIRESGKSVVCEPLKGYPLEVMAASDGTAPNIRLTVCGKNLYDATTYPLTDNKYIVAGGGVSGSSNYAACEVFIPVSHLQGLQITLNHPPIETGGTNPKMNFYTEADASKAISDSHTNGSTATVPETANFMRFSVPSKYSDGTQIQIEIGSVVTEYEAYTETEVLVSDENLEEYVQIPNVIGTGKTMVLYAHTGSEGAEGFEVAGATTLKVTGSADPVAMLEKITNAIVALGANV